MYKQILTAIMAVSLPQWAEAQRIGGFPSVPLKDRRPAIGADYPGMNLRPETERMTLDNQDITGMCAIGGSRMSFEPGYDLSYGSHRVQFVATTQSGQRVENSWSFSIQQPQTNFLQKLLTTNAIPNLNLEQKFPTGSISGNRPEIGARFQGQIQNIRMLVDGQDVTNMANRSSNSILWQPPYNIDAGTHNVSIDATGIHGHRVLNNWTFQIPYAGGYQPQQLDITRYWPEPGPNRDPRSKLGADFNENISSARLFADGLELTSQCSVTSNGIRWRPVTDLSPGKHNLRVVARGLSGQELVKDWTFQVGAKGGGYAPSYNPPQPQWPDAQQVNFYPNGYSQPNAPVGLTLPPGSICKNYQMSLDGRDLTPYVHTAGNSYFFQPNYPFQRGQHQVHFTLWLSDGQRIDKDWTFQIQ